MRVEIFHKINVEERAITLIQRTLEYEFALQDSAAAKRYGNPIERWILLGGKSLGQRVSKSAKIKRALTEPRLDEQPPIPIDRITKVKCLMSLKGQII